MNLNLILTFSQENAANTYVLYEAQGLSNNSGQWIGLLAIKGKETPNSLTLKESFEGKQFRNDYCAGSNGASYFILPKRPGNLKGFVQNALECALKLNKQHLYTYRYFHWMPDDTFDSTRICSLPFSTYHEQDRFVSSVPLEFFIKTPEVERPLLQIQDNLKILFDEANDRFEFRHQNRSNVNILTLLRPELSGYWGRSKRFFIDFSDQHFIGNINAEISYSSTSSQLIYGIDNGLKYTAKRNGHYYTKQFEILGSNLEKSDLNLWFDPNQPLNPKRTQLTFLEAASFNTELTLNTGKPIILKSIPQKGGYALSLQKVWQTDWERDVQRNAIYLTPFGEFEIVEDFLQPGEQGFLLTGITGTELISFENKDILIFHPKQPAFIPTFPIGEHSAAQQQPLLIDDLTTSWVTIKKGGGNKKTNYYFSQSEETPLFEPTSSLEHILEISDISSAPLVEHDEAFAFPLAPSALAKTDGRSSGRKYHFTREELVLLEQQILGPVRKTQIDSNRQEIERQTQLEATPNNPDQEEPLPNDSPIPDKTTTTPQGFLVTTDENSTIKPWKSLILANNQGAESAGLNAQPDVLEFKNVIPELQSALQTSELFMVVSNPQLGFHKYFEEHFDNKINIAGWPFLLDILSKNVQSNLDTPFKNIVIFKFGTGSLIDRIKDKTLWTQPGLFNDTARIPALQEWILQYIDDARKEVEEGVQSASEAIQDEGIARFLQCVDDPNWNGILALKVTLELNELPDAIKSILAGIDLDRFAAHHFGVEVNKFEVQDGKLKKEVKSSLFGLISYYDEVFKAVKEGETQLSDPLPAINGDFDFKVLNLQALFKNSALVDFNCKIQLSFKEFFGDPIVSESYVSPEAINRNSIVLKGLYEKQNGRPSYNFYQDGENELSVESAALTQVGIGGVGFTLVDNDPDDDILVTRFALAGALRFHDIGDFDLFTYDSLSFEGMLLDLEFNLTPPRKKTFTLKPTSTRFRNDRANSSSYGTDLRLHGFARHFPMQIEGIVTNQSFGGLPGKSGYMAIDAPLDTQPIRNEWYALKYKVNMGTLGALAEKAGFDAYLLVAWSPGANGKTGQIHMKIPFSGGAGAKGFSLQGVLKLAVGSIKFEKKENTGEYALLMTHLGLKLLGITLPPTGNTIMYLFGDPNAQNQSGNSSVGWFGAYNKDCKQSLPTNTNAKPIEV